MAVDSTNKEYNTYKGQWRAARDATSGQRAIHEGKELYLARLTEQSDDEYKTYKNRALFYEATGRTVDGLTGMVFRNDPKIEPGGMQDFIDDVTMTGISLEDFAKQLTMDVLTVGRAGVLVDFPDIDTGALTVGAAKAAGARPFFKHYAAESIINWKAEKEVRLAETIETPDPDDEFGVICVEQIRVLDLDETGFYRQRIYQKVQQQNGSSEWTLINTIEPKASGNRLDFIPFLIADVNGDQYNVNEPPLMGLVNVNISHYKNSADLEHGAHFTGLPTAVITGMNPEEAETGDWKIGATTAWLISNADAKVSYLEFQGQGLETLERMLQAKESKMASLGAQMLTPDARRNEAAETAGIRHMGENSILSSMSASLSGVLNTALEYATLWLSGTTPATIELNQDFMPQPLSPQMLKELMATWQAGGISAETLFENLKAGEIISSEKTFEEEESEKQTNDVVI